MGAMVGKAMPFHVVSRGVSGSTCQPVEFGSVSHTEPAARFCGWTCHAVPMSLGCVYVLSLLICWWGGTC